MKLRITVLAIILLSVVYPVSGAVRPATSFDHQYDSLITSVGSTSLIFFQVTNEDSVAHTYQVDAGGSVSSSIAGQNQFTLSSGQSKRLQINVEPGSEGSKTLTVNTTDVDLGIKNVDKLPVLVRDPVSASARDVPGIAFFQLLTVLAATTVLYSASL